MALKRKWIGLESAISGMRELKSKHERKNIGLESAFI